MANSNPDGLAEDAMDGFSRDDLDDVVIEGNDIPLRGSPDEFLTVVEELKGTGTRRVSDLNDTIDDFGSTNLSANVKYGENLGFIERATDGIILTDEGFELAYAQENDENLTPHFIKGLKKEENYLSLLLEFDGEEDYQSLIKNSDVLQVMYTNHDLREESETVLKRAVSIMFETLELAGFGEMKEAGGDYPRRFSFSDDWSTDAAIDELVLDESKEAEVPPPDEAATPDREDPDEFLDSADSDQSSEEDNEEEDFTGEVSEDTAEISSAGEDSVDPDEVKDNTGTQEVVVNIDLKIDVNEMDSAELGEKIEHINKLVD